MKRICVLFVIFPLLPLLSSAQGWQWQNPLPRGNTVHALTMLDELRGVAVCDDGIMLWSADGGNSWASYRIATVDLHDIVRMDDGTLLIAADRRRILRSTDNAYSWTLVYQGSTQAAGYTSEIARVDERTVVAFLNGAELVKSVDGGLTWQAITSLSLFSETPRSISIQSPNTWWLITNRNTWVTNTAGETWNLANDAYPARGLQRFVFTDSLTGFQCREGQLLRTFDGCTTWEEMNIFGFGVVMDVAAGNALGNDVYCLSTGRYLVNKSSDAGATWNISLTESAFADANVSAMTFANSRLGFLVGDGGRILRTENGGQSWSVVHGLGYIGTIAGIHFFDQRDGIAFTYSNTVLLTTNGGDRWDESIPSSGHTLRQFSVAPSGLMYAIGFSTSNDYQLFRSPDRGHNWEAVGTALPIRYTPFDQLIPQSLLAISDQELLIGVSYARLYRSTDAGMSWDSSFVRTAGNMPFLTGSEMQFFPPSTIYYSLYNALAVSTDDGQTWDVRQDPSGSSMLDMRFLDINRGFSTIQGRLCSTTDGGQNWKRISQLNTELYHFFDASNGILLSSESGSDDWAWLYRTNDGGGTWNRESLGGQVYWNGWFFLDRHTGWAFSYGGLIQKTTTGGVVGVETLSDISDALQLGDAWPNPLTLASNAVLRIPFALEREQHIRLSICDMLGRETVVLTEGVHQRGLHVATFTTGRSSSVMPPGVYILRLVGVDGVRASKVILR
ncbi:MAG: YCF48-related protein [Bacteroidia bacterium]|nr:YCF48-related protein [Bacteroidia bacterium]